MAVVRQVLVYVCISFLPSTCLVPHNRYHDINRCLKNNAATETMPSKQLKEQASFFAAYVDAMQNLFAQPLQPRTLTPLQRITLTLQKMQALTSNDDPIETTTVIDEEVWRNLDLFTNQSNIKHKTIIGTLKRTATTVGELTLTRMLLDPTTNTPLIKKRQAFIAALLRDDQLFTTVSTALEHIASHEDNLLSLLEPSDMFNQDEVLNAYNLVEKLHAAPAISTASNLKFMYKVFSCGFPLLAACLCNAYTLRAALHGKKAHDATWFKKPKVAIAMGSSILFTLFALLEAGNFKKSSLIPRYTMQKLSSIGAFLHNTHLLKKLFLHTNVPELATTIAGYDSSVSEQLASLDRLLYNATFTSVEPGSAIPFWHYFFSNKGDIANGLLATKKLLPDLLQGLTLIGLLDAYLSIAKLIKERAASPAPYCFVQFIEHQTTPIIDAHHFHHPSLPMEKTVTNSLTLGINGEPRNLVISGVNAGGKSTIMKSLALCCILGQSFGIAPARSFTFTPFSTINTYLNITDDMSNETSLFKAELARAQKLLGIVKQAEPGKLSFTLLDEICRGTEHTEGEALAYAIAKKLGEYPHTITLIASHFPGLIQLGNQEQTLYKNMKVIVTQDSNRNFIYPYRLYNGSTTQQIAPDLLERIGLPTIMTDKMRDVLNNPTDYVKPKD